MTPVSLLVDLTKKLFIFLEAGAMVLASVLGNNATVLLCDPKLVESVHVEPWMQRTDSKLYLDFQLCGGPVP